MDALLLCGGDAPPRSRLANRLSGFGLVCAADSGLDLAREWGIAPDLIVGDLDSVSDPRLVEAYPKAELVLVPREKDLTDTELGIEALFERTASRIVLAGGGGGRLDHLLAIRAIFEREQRPSEWHTAHEAVYALTSQETLSKEVAAGSTVSVFPLGGGATGMESEGLAWPLKGLRWGPGDFGVSNVAREGRITIRAGEGGLLIVILV